MSEKKLNFTDLTVLVISFVIGMGIFKTPAKVAATSGSETVFIALWIVGGIIALAGALVFAEIGVRLPIIGAYYKSFNYAYHPIVGFVINILILISNAASLAVVTLIGAEYASDLIFGKQIGNTFFVVFSIVSIFIFLLINLLGLRASSATQNILLLIKVAMIVLLICTLFFDNKENLNIEYDSNATILNFNDNSAFKMFLISLMPVCFSYGGYQQTTNFGAEIKNKSIMVRSIIVGIVVVTILYVAINFAYLHIIGFDKMKNANVIGAHLCQVIFGNYGKKIFDFVMLLSVLAYINVILLSNPRLMCAMASDGLLPKFFEYRNPKTQTLTYGLVIYAILTMLIVFLGKGVDSILDFTMFLDCSGMIGAAGTIFALKNKVKLGEDESNYHFFKYTKYLAVFFMLSYLAVAIGIAYSNFKAIYIALALMSFFCLVYFFIKRSSSIKN